MLLLAEASRLAYAVPLLVGVSLVYSATRHEEMPDILAHARSFGLWTVMFMAGVGAVIETVAFFQ